MKLAVTGGAGFLGYHICHQLKDLYDEIYVLDIAPIDEKEYPQNAQYVQADVRDKAKLEEIFKDVDCVVHGAAALPLWKKEEIYAINIQGTENVLEAAKTNNIQRVVAISSTAVYGVPEKHPLYESDEMVGVGPYGESKIEAENVCLKYQKQGMCVPVIRPKTFIGTGRLGVFQILYNWVEEGRKIPIIGSGKNRYQLLEVEDLVQAIRLTLTADADKANDVFNVGAETFHTVEEDVGALCQYAGTGARVMPTPAKVVVPILAFFEFLKLSPLYKWVYGTAGKDSFVSVDKIKNQLGWTARYSNADALIRSYKWYMEHKEEVATEGITHRVAWKQGILGLVKKCL
ncbi:MAG: NAD(P)-dependent oxidoreductase [Candidatus Omnitrophica bacterium]|nr:NAD(P)-dependent oxidoreductase [Candidatus Omnitrophota bacterium]